MRRQLLAIAVTFGTAAWAAAQPPALQPPGKLPADLLKGPKLPPGAQPLTPPAPAQTPPAAKPAEAPAPPQKFDAATLRVKQEGRRFQLWAGPLMLKDFGPNQAEANEALQVFRDLRVNAHGSVGGVFEYWLADGKAPTAPTQSRRVVPFDPAGLRVEQNGNQWVLRDAHIVLYNFGAARADAEQALAVCKQYGFNQMGYVGHPAPTLKYLMADSHSLSSFKTREPIAQASWSQVAEAPRPRLVVPGVGEVGERVVFDDRNFDLRRENGEWVLYAGRATLGRFGMAERDGQAAAAALEQFRVTEVCRVGQSGFGFFLACGRPPQGTTVGLNARPLRPDSLEVRQVGDAWAVCDGPRTVFTVGARAEDARAAVAALKYYRFDAVVPVGNGHLGNTYLFVKNR